ncbi:class I SAM-dependent methyltransferase [Amycolatopsis samaneae]|uniref:Methyltransferase n=1 Tax=Amycolatopsis samaneae TaxID=664691 RepID=A0ABW5GRS4_9PSEU
MSPFTQHSLVETLQAYKRTSLLKAGLELRVFDALADGPAEAATVAKAAGTDERRTAVLLGALAAVGLLDCHDTEFALPEGGELLVSTGPGFRGGAVKLLVSDAEWDAMRDLATLVRTGGPALATDPGFGYWQDFAAQATFVTKSTVEVFLDALTAWAVDRPAPHLLDLGCGHALFGLLFTQRFAHARMSGLDGADVLPAARAQAARLDVTDRAEFLAGDAFTAPLDGPYDVVVAANLLPLFSPERCAVLLRRIAGVLRPGGRLVLAGFVTGERPPAEETEAHLLSLLMLAWTTGGQAHSVATYRALLAEAGFGEPEVRPVGGLPVRVLVAGTVNEGNG